MYSVRIEHPIPDFDNWKRAFDSDPVGRESSGVRRYEILQPIDNPNLVMIDLDFDDVQQAEKFLSAMRAVWGRVEGTIVMSPQARIVKIIDSHAY